jgi:UDP-GlcNAc:undecaprenyl-phosphate GlcNAc-1-phosphate transferase
MIAVYVFLLALFLSAALVPLLARVAEPLGLVDRPGARKIHLEPVPRVGGIAVLAGVLVATAVWLPVDGAVAAYLVAAGVIGVFGVLDDRVDLNYRIKFAAQIAAALLVIALGDVLITRMPFTDWTLPVWLSVPVTTVAIVGVTNAMNLADGLDSLAGGLSLLVAAALGFLAFLGGDKVVALLAVALVGAVLGFLRYNTFPARVFLGDAGSQFLGFSIAVLAILTVEKANPLISPLAPLLILALPVLDTLAVMGSRIAAGRSPFVADRSHLHHRLLDRGLNQYEAVVVIYLLQVLLSVLAWQSGYWSDEVPLAIFAMTAFLVFGGLHLAEMHDIRWPHGAEMPSIVMRGMGWVKRQGGVARAALQLLTLAVPAFFIFAALAASHVPADVGWLALIMVNALFAVLLVVKRWLVTTERLIAFVLAVTAPFFVEGAGWLSNTDRLALHAFFVLLATAIALRLRFADKRSFEINVLDLLVVLLVLLVPLLPALRQRGGYGAVAIEALVLFYACDLLLIDRTGRLDLFRLGLIGTLWIVAVRGLWP